MATVKDTFCVDDLAYAGTVDPSRSDNGPICVKGHRAGVKPASRPVVGPHGGSVSVQVMSLLNNVVQSLSASYDEAVHSKDNQTLSFQEEYTAQIGVVADKKNKFEAQAACKGKLAKAIEENTQALQAKLDEKVSDEQLGKWKAQRKAEEASAKRYLQHYKAATETFRRRYTRLEQARVLIHNITARLNTHYAKEFYENQAQSAAAPSLIEEGSQDTEPRFQQMVSQLQKLVSDDSETPPSLQTAVQSIGELGHQTAPKEGHVEATGEALRALQQVKGDTVKTRGADVKVGSDVGGYMYLTLTRIAAYMEHELAAMKATFQLQTAPHRGVRRRAQANMDQLDQQIKSAEEKNEAVEQDVKKLRSEAKKLDGLRSRCLRDSSDAWASYESARQVLASLNMTVGQLGNQVDQQIEDLKHELALAKHGRDTMLEKLRTLQARLKDERRRFVSEPGNTTLPLTEVERDDSACLNKGPKDWCASETMMRHCGVTQAACDAYLLADKEPMADIPWPGRTNDGAGGSSVTKPDAARYYMKE